MILTDDDNLAEQCRSLRNLCFKPAKRFVHERLGWNLRLTNLQAAVGVAQLERLDDFLERKRYMGSLYQKLLGHLDAIQLPCSHTDYAQNVYWVFSLCLKSSIIEFMTKKFASLGIGTRPFFCPMHQQPVLRNLGFFDSESYPYSDILYQKGLYLPSGLALTDAQITRVANAVEYILT